MITVPVTAKFVDIFNETDVGHTIFEARPNRLVDTAAKLIIAGLSKKVIWDATGGFTVNLRASDDPDLDPSGFSYVVTSYFNGKKLGKTYDIEVPIEMAETGLDLSTITPVEPGDGLTSFYVTMTQFEELDSRVDALEETIDETIQDALDSKADLVDGLIPAAQLPSYVDDILEYADVAAFPVTGVSGKIYIALDSNKTYRWGGSFYVVVSDTIALGETSSSAYRGDRGKTAYDHSQLISGNPHAVTKSDVGLGSVDNTSDANKPVSTATQTALNLKTDATILGSSPQGLYADVATRLSKKRVTSRSGTPSEVILPGVIAITTGTGPMLANIDYYFPFFCEDYVTFDRLLSEVTISGAGGSVARQALYNADSYWQPTGTLIEEFPTFSTASTGIKTVTPAAGSLTVPGGRYLLVMNLSANTSFRILSGSLYSQPMAATLGGSMLPYTKSVGRTHAAFPSTGVPWTTIGGGGVGSGSYPTFLRVTAVG